MKSALRPATLVGLAIFVAGCGGYSKSSGGSSQSGSSKGSGASRRAYPGGSSGTTSTAAAGSSAKVAVSSSKLGKILVDATGRALYLFLKDKGTASTCSGPCATVWPPLVTQGEPQTGPGASAALLGTTKRTDGHVQVTYHGHPLYFYASDHAPGDTAGQALNQFGAEWYVLTPAGTKLEKKGS